MKPSPARSTSMGVCRAKVIDAGSILSFFSRSLTSGAAAGAPPAREPSVSRSLSRSRGE